MGAVWGEGQAARFSGPLLLAAEWLCEAVELRAGERVLDLATGDGNCALAAARRRAKVVALDLIRPLLARGRERAQAERLGVDWVAADLGRPPLRVGRFGVVLSNFGLPFVGDPGAVADSVRRLAGPGARIGLTQWRSGGFIGGLFARLRGLSRNPDAPDPLVWSEPDRVAELLGVPRGELRATERELRIRAESPEGYLLALERSFPPVVAAWSRLSDADRTLERVWLAERLAAENQAKDGTVWLRGPYLEVVATLGGRQGL